MNSLKHLKTNKIMETLEEVRKVERTELFNTIHSVVKKIPIEDVDGDAMDAPSCAYEIEQLFYKWQQEQNKKMYSEKEVDLLGKLIKYNERQWDLFDKGIIKIKPKSYDEVIEDFKSNKV